jgi:hypothetical protein
MTFLGIEIDSVARETRLPQEKIQKCEQAIAKLIQGKKATLRQIQVVVGLLQFACQAVVSGRAFLRRLIDLTKKVLRPHHFIKLTQEVKLDLRLWLSFLEQFNGRSFFLSAEVWSAQRLNLVTDASGSIGFGAVLGTHWFQGKWNDWWRQQNITLLELYPIVMALETWVDCFSNKQVLIQTDNMALVSILNKQTAKEPLVMVLIRRLVMCCLKNNVFVRAQHLPGWDNGVADSLSRFQMMRFRKLSPGADLRPTGISPLPERLVVTDSWQI